MLGIKFFQCIQIILMNYIHDYIVEIYFKERKLPPSFLGISPGKI